MEWSPSTLWWVLAGLLVVVELLTGSFYLLMLAIGAAAGALAAHLGLAPAAQVVVAAVVGAATTGTWHLRRARHPRSPPAQANRDVNLDIGERVMVARWDADGSSRVSYRGALWTARHAGPGGPQPGEHRIVSLDGNQLVLEPAQGSGPA